VAAEPALREARYYLERVGNWGLPVLDGVVETPTLRADGTVLANPGYDRASRLLLSTGGVAFPPMLDQPSEADARAALGRLIRPLRGFPFLPDEVPAEWTPGLTGGMNPSSSRSVALSAILTGVIRRTLAAAPMHAFDAAEMGTGKSSLAEIISLLATGQSLVPVSQGKDPVEDEKKLFAALRRP
jgi:putative DNA primase/helicase